MTSYSYPKEKLFIGIPLLQSFTVYKKIKKIIIIQCRKEIIIVNSMNFHIFNQHQKIITQTTGTI